MQVASTAEPPPITSIGRNLALCDTPASRPGAGRSVASDAQSLSPLVDDGPLTFSRRQNLRMSAPSEATGRTAPATPPVDPRCVPCEGPPQRTSTCGPPASNSSDLYPPDAYILIACHAKALRNAHRPAGTPAFKQLRPVSAGRLLPSCPPSGSHRRSDFRAGADAPTARRSPVPRHVTHRVRERHRWTIAHGNAAVGTTPRHRQTSILPTTRASRKTQPPSVSRVPSAARAFHRLRPVSAGRLLSINEAWLAGVPVVSCDYLVNRRFEERHGPLMWLVPTPP